MRLRIFNVNMIKAHIIKTEIMYLGCNSIKAATKEVGSFWPQNTFTRIPSFMDMWTDVGSLIQLY